VSILADSGYWVALLDRDDQHHSTAVRLTQGLQEQLLVTWPVLTEAAHFLGLRLGPRAVQRLIELGERGAYRIHATAEHDLPRLLQLMTQYASLPMDLADATLVLVAQDSGDGRILSTDERDFGVYRFKQNKPFRNLMVEPGT
jgi:predicted nucleic acid-binding protein